MIRTLTRLTLGASLAFLTFPPDASAGRGGGYGGGGGYRGGGGYGGGGEYRGGGGGGYHGGEGGGGMSHSPSFSQPHSESGGSSSGSRDSYGGSTGSGGNSANHSQASSYANSGAGKSESSSANRNQSGGSNDGAAAAGAGYANNNKTGVSTAGAAAAGAGAANHNQSPTHSNAGAAAAGAGYANRKQSGNYPNAGAAAAGAGYSNRNQSGNYPNAGAAATGAGYANRNQSGNYPNAGAAALGAGYANNNRSGNDSNAGAAVAGAGYANNNGYNQYQPGVAAGYWNGNYGNSGMGGYGMMGMTSPSYGYGSTAYSNPYAGSNLAGGGGQSGNQAQPATPSSYDYSQPVNPAAAPPEVTTATDPATAPAAQAHQAFGTGDYAGAAQLTQQALAAAPNDVNLHELYALELFAQGNYEQAAAPLYAVLSVGPGWNWTTLIGNYTDASLYTGQLRALESFVRANPGSAKAQFVLAYHYISEGHGPAAIRPLEAVVASRPNDQVSAQLLAKLQPPSPTAPVVAQTLDPNMMPGLWVAQTGPGGTINLSMNGDSTFTWTFASTGKPSMTISGPYSMDHDVLTLAGKDTPGGPLVGTVASTDANHLSFKKVGAPANDPGLQFIR